MYKLKRKGDDIKFRVRFLDVYGEPIALSLIGDVSIDVFNSERYQSLKTFQKADLTENGYYLEGVVLEAETSGGRLGAHNGYTKYTLLNDSETTSTKQNEMFNLVGERDWVDIFKPCNDGFCGISIDVNVGCEVEAPGGGGIGEMVIGTTFIIG